MIEIDFDKIAKAVLNLKPNHFVSGPPMVDPLMKHAKKNMNWLLDFSDGGEAISFEKEHQINEFFLSFQFSFTKLNFLVRYHALFVRKNQRTQVSN